MEGWVEGPWLGLMVVMLVVLVKVVELRAR